METTRTERFRALRFRMLLWNVLHQRFGMLVLIWFLIVPIRMYISTNLSCASTIIAVVVGTDVSSVT